ncbi:VWA domain-containing protein [Propylenella binzhouense]|uniref:VWA domain-containing protein n=1 Tax=Propylenella binzhouense TaxID=2555902 RepID=UPI0019674259|nr:VWA domain-containing protein [Propylenella binzhouense]
MSDERSVAPGRGGVPGKAASDAELEAFLKKAAELAPAGAAARGRLVFALDATMSRQPTWDLACALQAGMFDAAGSVGGLSVQLVYFRGCGECRASSWVADTRALRDLMVQIDCRGGHTQIGKVLAHVRREAAKRPVAALAYVGDAIEEDVDRLAASAGELGLLGVRAFMFQEGRDPAAERAFKEIARLTNGAHMRFDAAAAGRLAALLAAVATYAAGGLPALRSSQGEGARLLLAHLK